MQKQKRSGRQRSLSAFRNLESWNTVLLLGRGTTNGLRSFKFCSSTPTITLNMIAGLDDEVDYMEF